MDNKRHQGGGALNTFFFGILVGVMLSLLFTTKKGRKLLKVITDEGVDRISHWEDILKNVEQKIDEVDYDDESVVGEDLEEEVRHIETTRNEVMDEEGDEEPLRSEKPDEKVVAKKKIVKEEVEEEKPTPKKSKRLFKGIRRKSS